MHNKTHEIAVFLLHSKALNDIITLYSENRRKGMPFQCHFDIESPPVFQSVAFPRFLLMDALEE